MDSALGAGLPGAAVLALPGGVVHLDRPSAVFEAMLEGWATQQRARFLKDRSTIKPRLDLVRRFARFTGQYPWQWDPPEAEAFFAGLKVAPSTVRNHQNALRLFCDYVTDARYGWPARCVEWFGEAPQQILHEWNTVAHVSDYEGQPARRPLTYDEVQVLFDAADGRAEEIRSRRRKGMLGIWRVRGAVRAVGEVLLWQRAKRRTVLTAPEMDWAVPVLSNYLMRSGRCWRRGSIRRCGLPSGAAGCRPAG
jgi:hypothetical protein